MASYKTIADAKTFVPPPIQLPVQQEPVGVLKRSVIVKQLKTKTKPFVEPQHYNLDEFEYERNGTNPGKIIIFNQELFDDPLISTRRGSRRDVNEIIMCFQRLGFNIYEDDILTDSTVNEILAKINSVLEDKDTLRQTNALIIFVLTHGHTNDELHAKDGTLKCSEIWTKFNRCTELERKPKMFVFQACKGDAYATIDGNESPYNLTADPSKLIDIDTFTVNQLGTDMLLLYSTLEGNLAFRNPVTGTWFIQELCKNFSSYGRRDDVISLITRTIKCVCRNYYNYDEDKSLDYQKQMPIFVSTLSKKFYLNRNKDRHVLLEINRKQNEIYDLLQDIVNHMHN